MKIRKKKRKSPNFVVFSRIFVCIFGSEVYIFWGAFSGFEGFCIPYGDRMILTPCAFLELKMLEVHAELEMQQMFRHHVLAA